MLLLLRPLGLALQPVVGIALAGLDDLEAILVATLLELRFTSALVEPTSEHLVVAHFRLLADAQGQLLAQLVQEVVGARVLDSLAEPAALRAISSRKAAPVPPRAVAVLETLAQCQVGGRDRQQWIGGLGEDVDLVEKGIILRILEALLWVMELALRPKSGIQAPSAIA